MNAVNPGHCATDLNAYRGHLSPVDGAEVAVRLALDTSEERTGRFHTARGTLPW
ncbi:hypothetical protein [Amycolatopsis sp.]|uniref:hypothetical protein n=1 Tax=Amycolatopsis sp. TaxID=37632 RepID=UPI002C4B2F47|nr:hypothetical protein [Amycolatopsis sp.]HVV10696.1 hypothetical protein [Amycolatopsis sp.]